MAGALGEMEEDAEQPPVETMFSVARDVPERVLMDETYTLRVRPPLFLARGTY